MRIIWNRDRFEFEGKDTYDLKESIEQAGGQWDGEHKVWYCAPKNQRLSSLRSVGPSITPEAKAKFEELESKRQEAIESSRASDSDIDIPAPSGLSYLPYQKAGIVYALKAFGDL